MWFLSESEAFGNSFPDFVFRLVINFIISWGNERWNNLEINFNDEKWIKC